MPVIFDPAITVDAMRAHPDWLYLTETDEARTGTHEPNAVPVATCRRMGRYATHWTDADYMRCADIIDRDLMPAYEAAARGETVVCPTRGCWPMLREMETRAPKLFQHVRQRVRELAAVPGKMAALNVAGG